MRVSLPVIVFVVFLVLKLLGKITWSWWLVTSPLWITVLFWTDIAFVIALISAIKGY